jgi:hypothetical protein
MAALWAASRNACEGTRRHQRQGGTGKTSLTASFAALARKAVLADCDVDARICT